MYASPGQGTVTVTLSEKGSSATATAISTLDIGVLLGDANGDGLPDPGDPSLFVPYIAASELLVHETSTDFRISMMTQALEAQIKIDGGAADPGSASSGFGLITDALK